MCLGSSGHRRPAVRRPFGCTMNKLLTPEDVCALFGISKSTLYLWVQQGKLPCIKLRGKLLRFDPEQLKVTVDGWQRAPQEKDDGCTQSVRKKGVVHGYDDRHTGARSKAAPVEVAVPDQERNRGLGTHGRRRRVAEFDPAPDEEV